MKIPNPLIAAANEALLSRRNLVLDWIARLICHGRQDLIRAVIKSQR